MKKLLIIVFVLIAIKVFPAPSSTMSIVPIAVDSRTIKATDENARNNIVATIYNAHDHTSLVSDTITIGTGNAGDGIVSDMVVIEVDIDGTASPAIRFNTTTNIWNISNDGSTFSTHDLTSGTVNLTGIQGNITGKKTFADIVATTADINAGTFDGEVGGTTPANGTFVTLIGTNVDGIIGANTPAAGTFTTIEATGLLTVTGGQIKFPASQSASADANTLDDYEEGTWTPVLGGSGGTSGQSYSVQTGHYIKIGNLVTCTFRIVLTTEGTITTSLQLQGLPFTTGANKDSAVLLTKFTKWTATAGHTISAIVRTNLTVANFIEHAFTGDAPTDLTAGAIINDSELVGSLFYIL